MFYLSGHKHHLGMPWIDGIIGNQVSHHTIGDIVGIVFTDGVYVEVIDK